MEVEIFSNSNSIEVRLKEENILRKVLERLSSFFQQYKLIQDKPLQYINIRPNWKFLSLIFLVGLLFD